MSLSFEEATSIFPLVLLLTWNCITSTPANQKHPLFDQVLTSYAVLEEMAAATSLTFAPSLIDVLHSSTPPTVAFLKTLPTDTHQRWAVYLLLLEQRGSKSKIYIGSGTESQLGVYARFREYTNPNNLPQRVKTAVNDGYAVTQKGLLCWAPLPTPALRPRARVLFVAMEAALSYVFWAMHTVQKDYGMSHICPWPLETLEHGGTCSHSALAEPVSGDHSLTPEQLEALAAELKQRRVALQRVVSQRHGANARLNDLEGSRAKSRKKMATYTSRHPDRVKESHKNAVAKAKANKKYYCAVCDLAFGKKNCLSRHFQTKRHNLKAAAAGSSSF